ncbi:hypothetical protein JCM10213_003384 [Rhodosporidiobolus nylandii]
MHFTRALLPAAFLAGAGFNGVAAAPLPAPADSSCGGINVGAGVHIGEAAALKIKQGDVGECPAGWTQSLVSVGLCIQLGGKDHKDEQQNNNKRFDNAKNIKVNVAHTSTLPSWYAGETPHVKNVKGQPEYDHRSKPSPTFRPNGVKVAHTTTTTSKAHRATTTAKNGRCPPGKTLTGNALNLCVDIDLDPLYVGGGGIKIGSGPSSTSSAQRAAKTSKPVNGRCPDGQQRGTGSLLDVCVDIDTDPLYVGAGIKIGSGPSSTSSAPRSGRTSQPVNGRCPDGTQRGSGSLLDLCVEVDTDPLYVGAGIKIGSGPATTTTPARGFVSTPRPSSGSGSNGDNGDDCTDGDALLGLCLKVGDLLGAKVQVGGSSPSASSTPRNGGDNFGIFRPGNGVKIGQTTTTTSARAQRTPSPSRNNNNQVSGNGSDLPACDGNDDPRALANACVKVGNVVQAGATVLGPDGTHAKAKVGDATVAQVDLDKDGLKADVPGVLKTTVGPGADQENQNSNGLVNVGVDGLLNAQVLPSPSASPKPRKQVDVTPNNQQKTYHQTSPIRTSSSTSTSNDPSEPKPLVSASAAVKVATGPSSNGGNGNGKGDCPTGQILHLGVCVKADVDVAGIAKVNADAKVGV